MTPGATAAAVALVLGSIAAASARESRIALAGLLVALAAAPLAVDFLPDTRGISVRIVGAMLTVWILRSARPAGPQPGRARPAWPTTALVALAGAVAGGAIAAQIAAPAGPGGLPVGPAGQALPIPQQALLAAGLASLAVAAAPVLEALDPIRFGIGLCLAASAVVASESALVGAAPPITDLALAVIMVCIAIAARALATGDPLGAVRSGPWREAAATTANSRAGTTTERGASPSVDPQPRPAPATAAPSTATLAGRSAAAVRERLRRIGAARSRPAATPTRPAATPTRPVAKPTGSGAGPTVPVRDERPDHGGQR